MDQKNICFIKKLIAYSVLYLCYTYIIFGNIFTLIGYPNPVFQIYNLILGLLFLWLCAVINHALSEVLHVLSYKFLIFCEGFALFYLVVIFIIGMVRYSLFAASLE